MRAFILGLVIGVIGIGISFLIQKPDLVVNGLLIAGLGSIILSGVFSGALASGDRVRANYSDEKDFRQRSNWSWNLFLLGIPIVLSSLAVYFLNKS